MIESKKCSRCNCTYDLSMFSVDKARKDGINVICKICNKKYRDEHKERDKITFKKIRERNKIAGKKYVLTDEQKEKKKIADKRYRTENKDKIKEARKEYVKEYYEKNRDILVAKKREYRIKNMEAIRKKDKEYWSSSRGRAISHLHKGNRRKIEKAGNISAIEIRCLIEENRECYWCGCELNGKYHLDHYIPLSKGGEHSIQNIVMSCPSCNLRKGSKTPEEFLKIILCSSYECP